MNQGGLKHAATESRLDNKRERRRGASGRAAALRRAPSDSDCSGETASLSADSGDRAVRPPPPPTRAAKSRSRRRGSEWEVLEGLKDGQRFEKRPDVFNGYLHKKRKWPLKGWHKRFFVVDGGILVYARSPTDVARGRLHGSVDVGLSVISAKARRRRIDIDADEFIYHLRAKTPDVFRTWLNVLKAHRLYRQHLLTFGARESVPKIHAPLEDLPPTDTSSHTSRISIETSALSSSEGFPKPVPTSSSHYPKIEYPTKSPVNWHFSKERKLVYFNFQRKYNAIEKINDALHLTNRSLCSMNCLTKFNFDIQKFNDSQGSTNAEKQMLMTDLESTSLNTSSLQTKSSSMNNIKLSKHAKENAALFRDHKTDPAAYYFFKKKRKAVKMPPVSQMRKSRKSTNLVKYKNVLEEPKLKEPLSRCLLSRKLKSGSPKRYITSVSTRGVVCDVIPKENHEVQVEKDTEHKSLQDVTTLSEFDRITEHLMVTLFDNHKTRHNAGSKDDKFYINQVVKELYDVKFSQSNIHPVKLLFRSLLEYWLKNTAGAQFKEALKRVKSIPKPSNRHFTQDKILSSLFLNNATKQTQFHGISDFTNDFDVSKLKPKPIKKAIRCHSPKRDTESFEKERRIQELERVLKSTVYVCDTTQSNQSKEQDILITRQLIDNLEKTKKAELNKTIAENIVENSNSSSEIPKIQETLNNLISDTAIPPDIAKEFLSAYLGILLNDSSKSMTQNSSDSSEKTKVPPNPPLCDVLTESVQRRASKNVNTASFGDNSNRISYTDGDQVKTQKNADSGELYLKDVLDKITTVFTKPISKKDVNNQSTGDKKAPKHEVKEYPGKHLIQENYDENAVVIDLSKYDLDHISMYNDPNVSGVMSITIKLKEKPSNIRETKRQKFSLKFCNETQLEEKRSDDWLHNIDSHSLKKIFDPVDGKLKDHLYDPDPITIELKPYISSSETTKGYCEIVHESEHSLDLSFKSSNFFRKDYDDESDTQPCFIVSSLKKKPLPSKSPQVKKKVHVRHNNALILGSQKHSPNQASGSNRYPDEYSVFEQATPKIIDEKFILLLLENLTLLSKNVPSLYKDINALYIKLKKKHEKLVRNASTIQGLSLLGRIYNDDSKLSDRYTQYETDEYEAIECMCKTDNKHIAVNTSDISDNLQKNVADISLSATDLKTLSKITEVQTEYASDDQSSMTLKSVSKDDIRLTPLVTQSVMIKLKSNHEPGPTDTASRHRQLSIASRKTSSTSKPSKDDVKLTASTHSLPSQLKNLPVKSTQLTIGMVETLPSSHLDKAVSTTEWYKQGPSISTNTVGVSTMIKAILEHSNGGNAVIARSKNFENVQTLMAEVGYSLMKPSTQERVRKDITKGLALLNPYSKASTQSQTDEIFLHKSKDINTVSFSPCSQYKVYRLVLSAKEPKKSNSTIDELCSTREESDDLKTIYRCRSEPSYCSESGGPLENASRELGQAQLSVQQLQRLLEALELQQQVHHDTDVSLEGASPNVKKDRRKFGLRKKKSNSKCASVEIAHHTHIDPSSSHMALSALTAPPSPGGGASSVPNSAASLPIACAAARPQSLPGAEALGTGAGGGPASLTSLTPDHQLREDFTVLAKDLVASLKGIVSTLVMERGRLRAAMEAAETAATPGGGMVAALRTNLTSALHQNSGEKPWNNTIELRSRLSRIHDASDLAEISSVGNNSDAVNRQFQQSLSYSSSCVSASEFFDAEEHDEDLKPAEILGADEAGVIELDGDSSSEAGSLSSEEGSASSDNSEVLSAEQVTLRLNQNGIESRPSSCWTRRTCLPCPRPTPGGPSLWNLLYKNIGKDLSQISMPVTINEPLNMLQRLCEELEYSELLDAAAECKSAVERIALIAAFAVSAYASSAHRAASKPFNPLLAETYECVRDDKGFRFIAEQVSHHPPISACHAESPRWWFWQEARIKTKFWGKSMEFQPAGRVHVRLATTGDHYSWNKVTTCVHNLFGGQRWVDQYGDMHITCHGTDISCKLQFIKASSWSSSRHEVRGHISGGSGTRLRLQGRWSEALYAGEPPAARCLWRPGAMPHSHELYYGFTRFAMELNEVEPGMRELLPHTDTRLRPDQRALEDGDIESAEQHKHSLEQSQRERRRGSPEHTPAWFRKKVESGEEMWVFTGEYWKAREAGFSEDAAPRIW